jgi:hypothetical protein
MFVRTKSLAPFRRPLIAAAGILAASAAAPRDASPVTLGLNKIELSQQYLGLASGGGGDASHIRVERAMARKAMADAHQIGARFFRVALTGFAPSSYGPRGDLRLWLSDPGQYWAEMDLMVADLRRNDLQLVPVLAFNSSQFPAMTQETVSDFLGNPASKSYKLFEAYVTQFINRYRKTGVVLFYELTNELNLAADIDYHNYCLKKQNPETCAIETNFTSDELVGFTGRAVKLIKSLDASALVSSGFSTPRPSAEHLRASPAAKGKLDWRADTEQEIRTNIIYMNRDVDIISVHVYPGQEVGRFGKSGSVDIIRVLKTAADSARKKLYIGEFGDRNVAKTGDSSYIDTTLDEIVALKISYASLWAWEFYQRRPFLTYDNPATLPNLEPGYTDPVLAHFEAAGRQLGAAPAAVPANAPPRVVTTWPLSCQRVNGLLKVSAVASAAVGKVARVEFWLDGKKIGASTTPPYVAPLDLAETPAGPHDLVARAYDTRSNRAEYQTTFVSGGSSAPCVVPRE